MCKPDTTTPTRFILASVDAYRIEKHGYPKFREVATTSLLVLGFLLSIEFSLRALFTHYQYMHPLLEIAVNRNILARHIGVDAFSCFLVSYLGWKASHINQEMIDVEWHGKGKLTPAFENRVFQYHPEAYRLCVYFFAYQLKNCYDTIVWNDGPEFVAHHILTIFTVSIALYPKLCHFYTTFYFGVSEISTGVLCLLANYDEVHGVKGLAEAFPLGKVALGGSFAVLFIICRVILWTKVSWRAVRDFRNSINSSDPRMDGNRIYMRYVWFSLSCLTVLQIIWLGEIFRLGYTELTAMGYL